MADWFDVAQTLSALAAKAAESAGLEGFEPDVRPADPRFGDLQANGALPYAKRAKTNPRQIAQRLVDELAREPELARAADLSIAGPGFVNVALKPAFLLDWIKAFSGPESLRRAASRLWEGETAVVDFSSPNTAKQMHVAHLRSIVVGEALCRLLAFCGAKVVRDNHLGDWGTPYGKLFHAYRRHRDEAALARDPLEELERLYRLGSQAAEESPEALEECRRELVALQRGDPESLALWERINKLSIQGLKEIYELLDVRFDCYLGESFYRDKVERVYRELQEVGLAREDGGALVVFHPEHPRFATQPFIVRKSDGASNYASTDLATMLYRVEHFKATAIVIVTDSRQRDHFEQLELTTRKWFERTGRPMPRFSHVTFGMINGPDGRPIKSRSGEPIRLKDLLSEAQERAYAIVTEKNPELPEEERRHIARGVGISAIKHADLSQNRSSDYQFSWERALSFEGNTAPYLLYAATRIKSIFRKAEPADLEGLEERASVFETEAELALARKIVGFVVALKQTADSLRPHFLTSYLYELAGVFSAFYNADKVIVDDPAVRARRLLLCQRALNALETGLELLGIPTLERM